MAQYEILRSLDRGGMAEVFLARLVGIEGFEKRVVLKRVLPHLANDPRLLARFIDEARVAAQLSHPHIVQIFELGEQQGRYFIAMEHVDGRNLKDAAKRLALREESVPLDCALRIGSAVLDALHYAHTRTEADGAPLGLVHRDVSPSNILVSFDGVVKLIDFGIARTLDRVERTQPGVVVGKAGYMSPEQLRGERVDARADVFSCAASLFHVITGALPYPGTGAAAVMHAVNHGERRAFEEVAAVLDRELFDILSRGFAHEVDARYPDALSLQADLDRYAIRAGLTASTATLSEWMRRTFDGVEPPAAQGENTETQSRIVTLGPGALTTTGTLEEPAGLTTSSQPHPTVSLLSAEGGPPKARFAAGLLLMAVTTATFGGALGWLLLGDGALQERERATRLAEAAELRTPSTGASDAGHEARVDEGSLSQRALDAGGPSAREPREDAGPDGAPAQRRKRPTRRVQKESVLARKAKAPATATLTLDSEPWSEVIIDGRRVGLTPLHSVELAAGRHELSLRNPKAELEKRVTLTLRPGEARRMKVRLAD